jgi:hypothetical protein
VSNRASAFQERRERRLEVRGIEVAGPGGRPGRIRGGAEGGAVESGHGGQLWVGKWKLEPLAASVRGHREVMTLARV